MEMFFNKKYVGCTIDALVDFLKTDVNGRRKKSFIYRNEKNIYAREYTPVGSAPINAGVSDIKSHCNISWKLFLDSKGYYLSMRRNVSFLEMLNLQLI